MRRIIKQLVNKLMPNALWKWGLFKMLKADYLLLQRMSRPFESSEDHALAKLTFNYHRIEKGLTMPDFRPGFGAGLVKEMMADLIAYETAGYSKTCTTYRHAVGVLYEYVQTHRECSFDLGEIGELLNEFFKTHSAAATKQLSYTSETFFAHSHEDFAAFAASRHTVRHYAGRVPERDIIEAVELASLAPQACNRRFTRVHLYQGEKVQQLLAMQNGNRGFGHLCEQLLVLTADTDAALFGNEWHDLQTNVGIFAMNLSYALHYKHVAHCLLNLWRSPGTDSQFRRIAEILPNEVPVLCISCGQAPTHFKVAGSPKPDIEELLTVHAEQNA